MSNAKQSKYYNKDLNTDIKVLTKTTPKIVVNEKLPELPTNLIFYAKSNSGKTNVILNLLEFYKKIFKDRILIISKAQDISLESLAKTHGAVVLYDLYDENGINYIEKLINYQKKLKAEGKKLKNYLVLLEDLVGSEKSLDNRRSIFTTLFSQGRHSQITTIITTQQYSSVPCSLRRMAWGSIIFKMSNIAERKLMTYEMCGAVNMNEKQFEKIYDEATTEPYSFLYVDSVKNKWSIRFGGLN